MITGGGDTIGKLRFELNRLSTLDPFQVLDLKPDSDGQAVRAAYLALTKRYHPNRYARDSLETRDAATEVFLIIRRAYALIGDDAKRKAWRERIMTPQSGGRTPPPEPVPIPPMAQGSQNAPEIKPPAPLPAPRPPEPPRPRPPVAQRPAAGRPATKPPEGPPPASITGRSPDEVRALLEEARTRGMRFEQANKLMADSLFNQARVILQKLQTEDPQNKRYRVRLYHAWGLEHLQEGRPLDAVRELERAVGMEPDNTELTRALAVAKEKREAARGGVFSKLFRR